MKIYRANNKVIVVDSGKTLFPVQCGLLPSDFPSDTIAVLHHLILTCSNGPFHGVRGFYNPQQLDSNCPEGFTQNRKASFQALAHLPVEMVISPVGQTTSPFTLRSLCSTFLFVPKIGPMIP